MLDRNNQERLNQAWEGAPDCPSSEAFLKASLQALSSEERQRVEDHASECPRCAAEQALAQAFDKAAHDDPSVATDVDFVIAKLASPVGSGGQRPTGNVRRFPKRSARRPLWSSALAAAAVLALVMVGSVAIWRSGAPALPQPPGGVAVRGSHLELVAPVGDIAEFPASLQWLAVSGADRYRVTVLEVDRSVLFEAEVDGVAVDLPQDIVGKMSAAVVYVWQVEAQDATGKRMAWSDPTKFRVEPRGEDRR